MSSEATGWAWKQKGLTPCARLVLLSLCEFANRDFECWPSQSRIAADIEIPRETVNRLIKQLIEKGLIEAKSQNENGVKLVSRYFIRCDLTSHGGSDLRSHQTPVSDVISDHINNLLLEDIYSVAKATGAAAPAINPTKDLFDRGKAILGIGGGSILGKMRKAYGDVIVLEAIVACEQNLPSDPASYFIACCKQRKSDANTGSAQSAIDKLALWAIAEDERQSLRGHPEAAA